MNAPLPMTQRTVAELSALPRVEFVAALDGIFEHSPWVAESAWEDRPFATVNALHDALCQAVVDAGEGPQLDLIRAHPELARGPRPARRHACGRARPQAGPAPCTRWRYGRQAAGG